MEERKEEEERMEGAKGTERKTKTVLCPHH